MNRVPGVLVVDDDEDHLFVARRALERSNLQADLCIARDGADALRLLGLLPEPADPLPSTRIVVVMLDLRMPGLSGWEVLRRVRDTDRTRHLPVVVVSSSDRADDVQRSYMLGANSYVVKRFQADQPGAYLAEAARYWIELNELESSVLPRR
jgi:CheY-like chemotaxis protein